jgi:senataxin
MGRQQDLKAKASVLREAQIVCSTLSVAGSGDLKLIGDSKFETVVIDEASQAIELSTLIPLQMGCCRLVLVGDHKQLPATVFSKVAESHLYSRSLFERLHHSGYPMSVLKRQMRMHPEIARFPSELFYGGEIEDAPNILQLVTKQEWYDQPVFGPLVFFDIEEGKETVSLQSKVNEEEAAFVEIIISTLIKRYPTESANRIVKRTAVVTPYSEQVRLISDKLRRLFGVTDLTKPCPIEVNTVDGFQGREKDIIIASTVRASQGSIGFLADIRRMNVMLTRARTNMWIIGHRSTLTKDPSSPWAQLVNHIDQQKKVVKVTHPLQSFFPRILPELPRITEDQDAAMQ